MVDMFGELSPVLIIGMIVALVEFCKTLGVQGKASLVLSLVLGLVLGVGYQVAEAVPVTFADWFAVVIFSLLFGLVASGFYDFSKNMIGKVGSGDAIEIGAYLNDYDTNDTEQDLPAG